MLHVEIGRSRSASLLFSVLFSTACFPSFAVFRRRGSFFLVGREPLNRPLPASARSLRSFGLISSVSFLPVPPPLLCEFLPRIPFFRSGFFHSFSATSLSLPGR